MNIRKTLQNPPKPFRIGIMLIYGLCFYPIFFNINWTYFSDVKVDTLFINEDLAFLTILAPIIALIIFTYVIKVSKWRHLIPMILNNSDGLKDLDELEQHVLLKIVFYSYVIMFLTIIGNLFYTGYPEGIPPQLFDKIFYATIVISTPFWMGFYYDEELVE